MSGEYPFPAKIVSPAKCNEKPWDLWVSEIGHISPKRDDEAVFTVPGDTKGGGSRRVHEAHPYKAPDRQQKSRRAGFNRLRLEAMSLHGLFPQMDNLNAAVCHMCGVIVKCSAAYRHLLDSHTGTDCLPPPRQPVSTVKNRSRHKKEAPPPPPPVPVEMLPAKLEASPVHTATAPLSRIVLPQPELQYMDEASTSAAVTGEVQVCVESGELPVVSIQDTDDLRLGENLTDDIFAIMNSEGIQSADDITNAADWKNIIQDIGNMQEINFAQATEPAPPQDLYSTLHTSTLPAYTTLTDADLSSLQFVATTTPMLAPVLEASVLPTMPAPAATPKPAPAPPTPTAKASSRPKTSKTKFNLREYDPNKHCGVVTAENPKPCTRSLTCKAHALSLRRTVEGRVKPFDTLLAEHRASRDANAASAANAVSAALAPPAPHPPPPPAPAAPLVHPVPLNIPPLLVNTSVDLGAFGGLTAEQQVNDIYASLLSVEDPNSVLPDTSSITPLLSQPQPLAAEPFLMPDDADMPADVSMLSVAPPRADERAEAGAPPLAPLVPPPLVPLAPQVVPADVCWYASCPRPLALCTFNASHAGGAITLGRRFATVRSDIKSSLSRSQAKAPANSYFYASNALSLSKSVHMNASKTNKPEVRKLIVTCGGGERAERESQALRELFVGERLPMNGHVGVGVGVGVGKARHKPAKRNAVLDLGFALDPLLADEKC